MIFSRREAGVEVEVEIADAAWFGVRRVPHLWETRDASARAWLEPHRREAERLLRAVEARASMLRQVATVIARRQREFLVHGDGKHVDVGRGPGVRLENVVDGQRERAGHGCASP